MGDDELKRWPALASRNRTGVFYSRRCLAVAARGVLRGDGFDYITDSESEHTAEREEQVRSLQSEVSALRNELAAARAEGMERTAKATIAVFTEIAGQRAAVDQLMEKEREKHDHARSFATEREEQIRALQAEVSGLRNELTVVRGLRRRRSWRPARRQHWKHLTKPPPSERPWLA